MDEMLAPGAHKAMRGRGGVRCQVISDGILHRGPAVLISPVPLEPERAGEALFHALAAINYNGPITFESFSSAVHLHATGATR